MVSKIYSAALFGIDAFIVGVEIDFLNSIPSMQIIGLPDIAVKESKERVKSAIKNSGYKIPPKKIVVNLSPANTKKEGAIFDLPIAIGIVELIENRYFVNQNNTLIIGELSLDGIVRPIRGALSIAIEAKRRNFKRIILPSKNTLETVCINGIEVYGVNTLLDVLEILKNINLDKFLCKNEVIPKQINNNYLIDYSEVKGLKYAKRALEIAAAGNHNILLYGPPGSGKTMLSKRITTILPEMNIDEAIETTKIYSSVGKILYNSNLIKNRPFRNPHHSASDASIIGGGRIPKVGEISLAHNGILFLDEFTEFKRNILQLLRVPLEQKSILISRAEGSTHFPANFLLVAAMNSCPCGYKGSKMKICTCSDSQIKKYLSKISGPILDRIDIHIKINQIEYDDYLLNQQIETSNEILNRVKNARKIQKNRICNNRYYLNAMLTEKQISTFCNISNNSKKLFKEIVKKFGISIRANSKILKLSRTIADLDNQKHISESHLLEAIQYRSLDRKNWI